MVRTRRSKAPTELKLEASPKKNGFLEKNAHESDMETDLPEDGVRNGESSKVTEKSPKDKSSKKTMKERLEKEVAVEQKTEEPVENPVKGGSMAVVLTQGLMANDPAKVDTVLRQTNLLVIQSTLQELNVSHVIPLLKALELRLHTRQATDIRPWLRWLQCTMSFHMSYLATQRTLNKEIGSLMEWMRSRALHQQKLFQLHGKIGVLVDQMERRNNNAIPLAPQPLIIFNNDELNDSDVDEIESLGSDESGGSSEEDWWDDGEIRQEQDDDDDEEDEDEELEDIGGGRQSLETNDSDEDDDDDDDEADDDEEMEED